MKERLEAIIREEREERKDDADYLTDTRKFLKICMDKTKKGKNLDLQMIEFAVYETFLGITLDNPTTGTASFGIDVKYHLTVEP